MKKVKNCVVENCVPTPSSCTTWNGGDIDYLGICNGESLNNIIWEIVGKLQAVSGEDLSKFDIDSLLEICNLKAPIEVSLINILNVLKQNNICLKDYINTLSEQIAALSNENNIKINLKCYQDYDNLGNSLEVSREQLDQLVINELCNNKTELDTLSGKITNLQAQIDTLDNNKTVDELSISTCVDATVKPTSSQVKSVAQAHCDLQTATGSPANIANTLSVVPSDWNTLYGNITGWKPTIANEAELISNMILIIKSQGDAIKNIQENCCAIDCDSIKIGYNVTFDTGTMIITFSNSAGLKIPVGFVDKGSTGTVTDMDGKVENFSVSISEGAEIEISLAALNTSGKLDIMVGSKIGNGTLLCQQCVDKEVKVTASCDYCEITNTGSTGTVTIIYEETTV